MNISEIAKLAGVSQAAVSRYLNNGYLSEEKRQRIKKVIEETGYRPLAQAQSLRNRKNKTIGVILPKIESFSVDNVVAGILSVLNESGYQLLLANTENSPQKELEYLDVFDEQRVEGVILLASVISPKHLTAFRKMRVPFVVIGQEITGVPCVYHDDYRAFYEMTNLVLRKGCTNLVYMGGQMQDKAVGQERYRGFCDAVSDAGLEELVPQRMIADFNIRSGYETAKKLLEKYPKADAMICATDRMAVGALKYLNEQGIHVPEQLLLTGQGGSVLCDVTTPTITTMPFSYRESGVNGAELLLERIRRPDAAIKEVRLSYTIQEKRSTDR